MEVVEVNKNLPLNVGEIHPNFLHVKFKRKDGKIFSVIGMRNLFRVEVPFTYGSNKTLFNENC